MAKKFSRKRLQAGILFILIGALLLLKNLNILPFELPPYVFTWKMLLVVIGFIALINAIASRGHWIGGMIIMSIGLYFLLPEAFGISVETIHLFWPAVIIVIGLAILTRPKNCLKKKFTTNNSNDEKTDYMESTVIFGGGSKQVSSYDFKGGKIITVFGGQEIDLSNCCLSKEKNVIELEVIFGGVELKVPKEWNVIIDVTPIMGGIEDSISRKSDAYVDPAAEITIKGTVVMGGVEIKRV